MKFTQSTTRMEREAESVRLESLRDNRMRINLSRQCRAMHVCVLPTGHDGQCMRQDGSRFEVVR